MSWVLVILLFLLISIKNNSTDKTKGELVSIVIPAYNEEDTVPDVVLIAKKLSYVDEIIVVDDGSYDKTAENARKAGAIVISHVSNQGKGSAIKTGFKHSKGDIIAFIDADIHNLSPDKIDNMIKPILDGKTDITKTKFNRESGRVTELTAKPLLRFFFPEITFEQPLSGQFAGKRSVLTNIKFEKDYGVDVGIVLDADAHGIQIAEVDIGEIKHDMSPLKNLNEMANEVVRTIIDRAVEYGRVTMMDSIGNYIRMATLGLSLIILGLFTIFFVQAVLEIGVGIVLLGFAIAIYYLFKLIVKSFRIFRNRPKRSLLKSFLKMHFTVIISAIALIIMISTFFSVATISDGKISIEPTSRNLVIFPGSPDKTIYVRGPYTVDSALENEADIVRAPKDVIDTLEINYGDKLLINDQFYNINKTRTGEMNILRLPLNVRTALKLQIGNVISDGNIKGMFEDIVVERGLNSVYLSNINTIANGYFIINSKELNGTIVDVYLDNKSIGSMNAAFENGSSYDVYVNGFNVKSIHSEDIKLDNSYFVYSGDHIIEIKFTGKKSTHKQFTSNNFGPFLSFNFNSYA